MKPKEGILYIIGDKIVCNEREKPPQPKPHSSVNSPSNPFFLYHECEAYKLWLESCKDVVNAHESQHAMEVYPEITILKPVYQIVEPGQRVLYVPEGDKVRITLLLGGPPNSKINN